MRFRCASHLGDIFMYPDKYGQLVDRIADQLEALRKKQSFTGMVFCGLSGAALAYPLSARLHIPLICVRKKGENSHGFDVEGPQANVRRYIIIDDFIETGATIKALLDEMDHQNKWGNPSKYNKVRCSGIVLYAEGYSEYWSQKFFTYKKKKIPVHYWG